MFSMILPGYQISHSANSSKFHHLALLVALVSHSSNFHHWSLLALLVMLVVLVTQQISILPSYIQSLSLLLVTAGGWWLCCVTLLQSTTLQSYSEPGHFSDNITLSQPGLWWTPDFTSNNTWRSSVVSTTQTNIICSDRWSHHIFCRLFKVNKICRS